MKIVLTLDEVKGICVKHLQSRGYKVSVMGTDVKSHVEGQFDESCEVVDGLTFELEESATQEEEPREKEGCTTIKG